MRKVLGFVLLLLLILSIILSGNNVSKSESWDYVKPKDTQRV